MHDLLNLFANIVVFGLVLWLVTAFIPMPFVIKRLLHVLVVIVLVIYILQYFKIINILIPMFNIIR